jgi:hypothetical protein
MTAIPNFDGGQPCAAAKGVLHSGHCFCRIAGTNGAAFDN